MQSTHERNETAAQQALKAFTVLIGPRGIPRQQFDVMAPDSITAHQRHQALARPGERIEVRPIASTPPAGDAVQAAGFGGQFTEDDLILADLQCAQHKGARFHRRNDAAALDLQQLDAMRRGGAL